MRRRNFLAAMIFAIFLPFSLNCGSVLANDGISMNGYQLKQFGDFTKWKMVTVRFRKDTDEMRIVYANDLAWKTLSEGKTDYPDGAIFAKIGAMTQPDPAFVSSATPSGARRVQFMVRDRQRHPDADGWGYALFDPNGKVLPGDQKLATQACAACHRIVPERGEVFSQIFEWGRPPEATETAGWQSRIKFEAQNVTVLPKAVRDHLPKSAKTVRVLQGVLTENPFAGTLDEIQPVLAAEARRTSLPAVLMAKDGKNFSLVTHGETSKSCAAGQTAFKGVHSLPQQKSPLFENLFCQ